MRSRRLDHDAGHGPGVLRCPSAQPDASGAEAFGLVDHTFTTPQVKYLERTVPVTEELLRQAEPLRPTEIYRFAATCQGFDCSHWTGAECTLVNRIVDLLPVASLVLPSCRVRYNCRWYAQQGRNACVRCPQVITQNEQPTEGMRLAARPPED